MQRLFPDHAEVDATTAYQDLGLVQLASRERPYVVVNMIETVDGQARNGDDTAELGDDTDALLFARLREEVDCVMAGPRTIGIENYNAPARRDGTQGRRVARGLKPRPRFAVATKSGVLPLAAPLFSDPEIEVIVFSDAEVEFGDARAQITLVAQTDPRLMLQTLREEFEVRALLLEGGPSINAEFFGGGLVDELFLTIAPVITGAKQPFSIVAGQLPNHVSLSLISALHDHDHLYLRYSVA